MTITAKNNKLIVLIKKLIDDRKYRYQTNLFVGETIRVIKSLLTSCNCQNLLVLDNNRNRQLLKNINNDKLNVTFINEQIYKYISSLSNGDGFIGIFKMPKLDLDIASNKKYLILNKLQNQTNLGLIIRSACAFNIDGIFITNQSVDVFHPDVIRYCMGNLSAIKIKCVTSLNDIIKPLKEHGYTVYATAINNNSKELQSIKFANSSAILIGNEGNGNTNEDIKLCDEVVHIRINKNVDSLNVAIATSIICYYLQSKY
ncbi:MAG: RNA methyltransferase [Mycoplasmataceae bacterium]|jgi:TrmH family RNA methyltransferase|nr:RNA methyltransferase [Mycoplasmataceae bacterium]